MKYIKTIFLGILIFLGSFFMQTTVDASTSLSFRTILPDNQYNEVSYFDLMMSPGEEQVIYAEITNSGDSEATVPVTINNASTNRNGVLDYVTKDADTLVKNEFDINSIVTVNDTFIVSPGETVKVPLTIKMPEDSYQGMILGGILFQEEQNDTQEDEEQIAIKNEFSHVIGLVLRTEELLIDPDMSLVSVGAKQYRGKNSVGIELKNEQMMLIDDYILDVTIEEKVNGDIIYETHETNFRMAPMSQFTYLLDINNKPLVAGNYIARIKASNDDYLWEFTEEFTISSNEASQLNDSDEFIEIEPFDWKLSLIFFLIIIVMIGVFLLNKKIKLIQ